MNTLNTERLALFATVAVTLGIFAFLIANIVEGLRYPAIV